MTEKKKSVKKQKKKKEGKKRYVWHIVFFAVLVLVFLVVLGIRFVGQDHSPEAILENNVSTPTEYSYNGFVFVKKNNEWKTQIEHLGVVYNVSVHHGPRELEDVEITYFRNVFSRFLTAAKKVYIVVDPESEGVPYLATASTSMAIALNQVYGVQAIAACSKNVSVCADRPIVTCRTSNIAVIELKHASPLNITYDGHCLFIQGEGEDLIRATDKAILGWYGIVE